MEKETTYKLATFFPFSPILMKGLVTLKSYNFIIFPTKATKSSGMSTKKALIRMHVYFLETLIAAKKTAQQ